MEFFELINHNVAAAALIGAMIAVLFYLFIRPDREAMPLVTIKTSPEEQRAIHKIMSLEPALTQTQTEIEQELANMEDGEPYESIVNDEWLDDLEHLLKEAERAAHACIHALEEAQGASNEGEEGCCGGLHHAPDAAAPRKH